jgi:putative ABC transport system permease protein
MQTGRLVIRLAWRNVRHRPWQALLLLLALSLSTTTITVALSVVESGSLNWVEASRATNGFHLSASAHVPPGASAAQEEQVRREVASLASAPGVVAAGGPWRTWRARSAEIDGAPLYDLRVQVRDPGPAAVDQPLVTRGAWLDGGDGVVLEAGLAEAADVRPGESITIAGHRLPVRGAAATVSVNPYPAEQPATVWIGPAAAEQLAADLDGGYSGYRIALRLADPGQAESFAAAYVPDAWGFDTWQEEQGESAQDFVDLAAALGAVAVFVAGLTIATAAILVAGRMAAQIRQVGTLKAVGVTPGQVTTVLLVEYLTVAVLATSIGLVAGTLLTPPLALLTSDLSVFGAVTPPITWQRVAIAAAAATAVVLLATVRPALRGVRRSTLRSLGTTVRPPRRAGRLVRAITALRLPVPVGLGLRAATRRPGRFVANTLGLTIGIAMVTTSLALDRGVASLRQRGFSLSLAEAGDDIDPDPISLAANAAVEERVSTLGFAIAAFLIGLALINATVAAVFSARDTARNHAILRTIGVTPRQTVAAFILAHLVACLLACAIGIPLGIAYFNTIRGSLPSGLSPLTYVTVVLAAPLLYALIALTPARLLARQPIAPQLSYE